MAPPVIHTDLCKSDIYYMMIISQCQTEWGSKLFPVFLCWAYLNILLKTQYFNQEEKPFPNHYIECAG